MTDDAKLTVFAAGVDAGLAEALRGAGNVVVPFKAEAATAAIRDGQRCAVVWQSPTRALAAALAAGDPPSRCLTDWQDMAAVVLRLFRANRRKLMVIEGEILTDPGISQEVDQKLRDVGIARFADDLPTRSDTVSLRLATLAVPQLEPIQDQLAELKASGLSCDARPFTLTHFDELAQEMQKLQADLKTARAQVQEQTEALAQLATTREAETTTAQAAQDEQARRIAALQADLKTARAQVQEQTEALAQLATTREAETTTAQAAQDEQARRIAALQADLKTARAVPPADDEKQAILLVQIEQLQTQLDETLAQPAVTAPQQSPDAISGSSSVEADLALSRALAQLRQESEARAAIEQELQQTRAHLARRMNNTEQLSAAQQQIARISGETAALLEAIAQQQRTQEQRQASADAELATLQGALAAARQQAEDLAAERERFLNSTSWKVTKPLRSARLMVHKPAAAPKEG